MKVTMQDKLLHRLKKGWTTPLDALQHCGCLSLSQRAGGFIRGGLRVQKKWVHLDNGKRVMSYRIG